VVEVPGSVKVPPRSVDLVISVSPYCIAASALGGTKEGNEEIRVLRTYPGLKPADLGAIYRRLKPAATPKKFRTERISTTCDAGVTPARHRVEFLLNLWGCDN